MNLILERTITKNNVCKCSYWVNMDGNEDCENFNFFLFFLGYYCGNIIKMKNNFKLKLYEYRNDLNI